MFTAASSGCLLLFFQAGGSEERHCTWTGTDAMPFNLKKLCVDRNNLGLTRVPFYKTLQTWKLTDALYVLLIFPLDWYYFEKIEPYQRQFAVNDITLQHPFAEHERVPGDVLIRWIMVIPATVMLVLSMVLTPRPFKLYVAYVSVLGVFISMGTCIFVTDVFKNWIGRCRPDFLARCIPHESALPDVLYFAKDICTTTDKGKLLDGFRTSPSGHSSMSWTAFGYLSLWLNGQLNCSHIHRGAWRSIIAFLPCLLAFYVALSRTQDYRHHFIDIILGSLLGAFIAWWSYRRYFPELKTRACYIPYVLLERIEPAESLSDIGDELLVGHDYYKDIQLAMGTYVPTGTDPIENDLESNNHSSFSPF